MIFSDYKPSQYRLLLRDTLNSPFGVDVDPRSMPTIEVSPGIVIVRPDHIRERVHWNINRWENPIFGYVEGLFILQGYDFVDRYAWYAPQMLRFVDKGHDFLHGAYGPRLGTHSWFDFKEQEFIDFRNNGVRESRKFGSMRSYSEKNQFIEITEKLRDDPDTRQAVMTIWNPQYDTEKHNDILGTIVFHFLRRHDKLNMIVYMRSQDLMTGFLYDTLQFRWFQEILAGWLDIEVGKYTHIAGSMHLYSSDKIKARTIINNVDIKDIYSYYRPLDCRLPYSTWLQVMKLLSNIEHDSRRGLINKNRLFDFSNIEVKEPNHAHRLKFYTGLAAAIMSVNAAKHGETFTSIEIAEQITSDLQVPTLARALAYHYQRAGKVDFDKYKEQPKLEHFIYGIKQYVKEKSGTLKTAVELEEMIK
jgi:hypothetical protein